MQKKKLKKIIAISGVVGTILTIKSIPANATELNSGVSVASISKGQVVNVTSTLRIREEASTNSSVLGTIRNGSTFDIISKSGGWYQIKYNGITGYVHGDYVKEVTASSSVLTKGKVYNVSTNLRVRSGASTNSSILGYITNNTEVSIVRTEGSWYKIQYNGGYGYVSKDYVTVSTDSGNNGGNDNSSASTQSGTIKVNGALNVRSGAGTNHSVIGSLSNGAKVEIVETSGTWYKIKYGSGYGYISKDYVVLNTRSIAEDTVLREGTAVTLSLKVRDESNYDSNVIGSITMGEKVSVLEDMGEWSKIQYKNNTGYILNEYVDFNIV